MYQLLGEITTQGWKPGGVHLNAIQVLTVSAYLLVALICAWALRVARIGSQLAAEYGAKDQRAKRRSATYRASFSFWAILTLLFVFLGMNKQLDLDGWFTETGRQFAINQGWYDLRWQIQEPMVVGIALIGVSLLALLLAITRSLLPRHTLAFVGTLLLVIFLILKTLSFHHLDNFLDRELASVRLGTIIEWIGMGCVALCAAKNCWWYKSGFIKPPINFAEESAPYRTG
ncbi:MAG: hypothetical protein IH984_02980 [Planctomycetes bacterium]|nr:hypothetical protein [Planctomycetota bacterium]